MKVRFPFCLAGALAIPVGLGIILFMGYLQSFHPSSAGGNIGGNNLGRGIGIILLVLGISDLLGLLLSILSLWRKERFRELAQTCFCFYLLPALLAAMLFAANYLRMMTLNK